MSEPDKEYLRYLRQMEAVGRLSGPIAHDINNLLSGILGYSELLLNEPTIKHLKPYIQEISNAGRRIAKLARILLIFSRKYAGYSEELNLNNAIEEIEPLVPYVLGPNIRFSTIKGSELWPVRADSSKIKQALITVAIDMREIMPDGGRFTLETRNHTAVQNRNQAGPGASGHYVQITALAVGKLTSDQALSCLPRPSSASGNSGDASSAEISNTFEIIRAFDGHVTTNCLSGKELTINIYLPAVTNESAE